MLEVSLSLLEGEWAGWVLRVGVGQGGEMTQALYAHINSKKINFKKSVGIIQ
jgi:hypothetical protein